LRDGPIAKREKGYGHSNAVRKLSRFGLFKENERFEGIRKGQGFIKQIWQEPEIVTTNPNKQKEGCSERNEEKDENEKCHRHVPDKDLEEAGPDGKAGAKEKASNQGRRHHVAECLIAFVHPCEIASFIKVPNPRHLRY
jgi:hypothetical protein